MITRTNVCINTIYKTTNLHTLKIYKTDAITTGGYTDKHFQPDEEGNVTYITKPGKPTCIGIQFTCTKEQMSHLHKELNTSGLHYLYCVYDNNDLFFGNHVCSKYKLYLCPLDGGEEKLLLDRTTTNIPGTTITPCKSEVILKPDYICTSKANRSFYSLTSLTTLDYVDHHFHPNSQGEIEYIPEPPEDPIYEGIKFPCTTMDIIHIKDMLTNPPLPEGSYLYCTYNDEDRYGGNKRMCSDYKLYLQIPGNEPIFIFEHIKTNTTQEETH